MRTSRFSSRLASLLAFTAVAGCSDGTGSGTAQLRIQITDAPTEMFDSAVVWISEVSVKAEDGSFLDVPLTDPPVRYDLLTLQNGVTADLGELEVEPGRYLELRLKVDNAVVGLAEPYEFDDGTTERSLKVPSGSQSGIKVKLDDADGDPETAGVQITPGETILVVDFDVSQNFKIQGNPNTPAGLKDVLFTPTLRAVVRDVAGSIAGTVTSSTDNSPLAGLMVRATLKDSNPPVEVTAITQADGTYVIGFLAPGVYTVEVDNFSAASREITVGEAQDVTGVNFSGTSTSP
jgi:hypothetical protein